MSVASSISVELKRDSARTAGPSAVESPSLNVDTAVRDRYTAAADAPEPALCCPVDYDARYLDAIPAEIIERDYGCGDPSKYVHPGDTVLDLGSGGGKACFICAQIVGPVGRVIGVDCNEEMLALARRHRPTVAERIGYDNIEFRKGRIQDLQLDLDLLDQHLAAHPVADSAGWLHAHERADALRMSSPLVADDSVDVVISNCVLNLVREEDRRQLFAEVYRVLKRGGRAVISDIVCDEDVPQHLKDDPQLWSGCISGAFREDRFLDAFADAGFYGIEILAPIPPRDSPDNGSKPTGYAPWVRPAPWAVIEGIEFRSLTVRAWKGKDGPCLDRHQAVIYNGPWKAVIDDDGHTLRRGQRMAVCDKTFNIYTHPPYADQITPVPPAELIPLNAAPPYDCRAGAVRTPAETKHGADVVTQLPNAACCGESGCC